MAEKRWHPVDWFKECEVMAYIRNDKVVIEIEGPMITEDQAIRARAFIVLACGDAYKEKTAFLEREGVGLQMQEGSKSR